MFQLATYSDHMMQMNVKGKIEPGYKQLYRVYVSDYSFNFTRSTVRKYIVVFIIIICSWVAIMDIATYM